MLCNQCGVNEAVVHLTQIENNEMSKLHLCEACAAAKGVEIGIPEDVGAAAPLTDFLAQMGKSLAAEGVASAGVCPACGLGTADLKRTGRLGCSRCYAHFAPHLRNLLRRLHGGTQHVGKVYVSGGAPASARSDQIVNLRRSLQRAIETEDFERAAQLRDQIREAEAHPGGGGPGEAG